MALIKCSECGNIISDKAPACPHCGIIVNTIQTSDEENQIIQPVKCLGCGKTYDRGLFNCPNCNYPKLSCNNNAKKVEELIQRNSPNNTNIIERFTNKSDDWGSVIRQLMELDYTSIKKFIAVIEKIQQLKELTDDNIAFEINREATSANKPDGANAGEFRNKLKLGRFDDTDIIWQILRKNGDRALIITEKAINDMPFDTKIHDVTWNDSLLRKWLNDNFYNNSFTEAEKNVIIETEVNNTSTLTDIVKSSENTLDRVFLLSKYEKEDWLILDKTTTDIEKWHLRSVVADGMRNYFVADGNITDKGLCTNSRGVRPVMWIDLSKL